MAAENFIVKPVLSFQFRLFLLQQKLHGAAPDKGGGVAGGVQLPADESLVEHAGVGNGGLVAVQLLNLFALDDASQQIVGVKPGVRMIRLNLLCQGALHGLFGKIPAELSQIHQPRIPDFLLLFLPVVDGQGVPIIFLRHQQIKFLLVQIPLDSVSPAGIPDFQQIRQNGDIHRLFVETE